jgi:phosphopantothenoylcysteine decarboxylase / phosphopantothenate---cysteine ligase
MGPPTTLASGSRTGSRVLLGVTGGIAAYKACDLTRQLVRAGFEVTPVLTAEAERYVSLLTFEALAGRRAPDQLYPHLTQADLFVIAPLTANTLAKLAHGLADNVLTELALAFAGPMLVAPAMNVRMWTHPATQANVAILRERGVMIVGPEWGELAEGEVGFGRMSEPEVLFERCQGLLQAGGGSLEGLDVVVSAGGTREPIDTVRFVGNRSSGKMGVAIASEARRRGARVTLLSANVAVPVPEGIDVVETPTAADLEREALARAGADVVVMAAAVADYRPAQALHNKRKKDDTPWEIELVPTADILSELGRLRRPGQILVGFAADEGESGLEAARAKRVAKGVNLLVFNDVSRSDIGFDAEENEVTLIDDRGERRIDKRSKAGCAAAILDEAAALRKGG